MVTEGLLRANLVEGEESVQKDGVGASEGKVVFREGVPGTGAEDESVEQDEPEAEKENDPPARTSETHKTEADKPVKPCPGDELHETEPDSGVAGGSLLPLGVTLAGSLLAEEDRSSGGQPTHKRCYKSKPFSAPGVEKRVLAAAKKGASQRDAILAEKRSASSELPIC